MSTSWILDKWNPARVNKKISSHFGLTVPQVRYLRTKPSFKSELPLLAISKSKLYRMVIVGEIPAVRFWGNIRIRMTDLEQLVAGYRKKPMTQS